MNTVKNENNLLKKHCNELLKERDTALQERDRLKHLFLTYIHQWESFFQERNDIHQALKIVQLKYEEMIKEFDTVGFCNVKLDKKFDDLNKAHNFAVKEYRLIMSERDEVHNEIEKLSEDLSFANNKIKLLENEIKSSRVEIKTLKLHVESLKGELSLLLHNRDEALKKCKNYQGTLGEISAENKYQRKLKSHLDYVSNKTKPNQNNFLEQESSLDLFGLCPNERIDNLGQANLEIERLRKLTYKYHAKLNKPLKETEVFSRPCDWALNEQDKIIFEHENNQFLRKQRDEALKNFKQILREFDDVIKKGTDFYVKSTKNFGDFKQKMKDQLEKEVNLFQLQTTRNNSNDFAIDTELQNKDTEILHIYLDILNGDLGIDLIGGIDDPLYSYNDAIYISDVTKGSVAASKLRVNDCILRVNNLDCSSVSKQLVLDTMKSSCHVIIVVKRKKITDDQSSLDFSVRSGKIDKDDMKHYIMIKAGKFNNNDTESNAGVSSAARPSSAYTHNFSNKSKHKICTQSSQSYSEKSMLHCFQPSKNKVSEVSQVHHCHSQSVDCNRPMNKSLNQKKTNTVYGNDKMHAYDNTFSRKKENPRFKIPSYESISRKSRASIGGILAGNIDRSLSRDNQVTFKVEVLNPGQISIPTNTQQSLPEYDCASKYVKNLQSNDEKSRPLPGEMRRISIKKYAKSLGIEISSNDSGGVFVVEVLKHSIASTVGIIAGDQLLEICGINLRSANYQLAKNVLQQCGDSITILVQYNPEKYLGQKSTKSSTNSFFEPPISHDLPIQNKNSTNTHAMVSLPHPKSDLNIKKKSSRLKERYYFTTEETNSRYLGIRVIGKSISGIFVVSVMINSIAYKAGLRSGDQILEYNGIDCRNATLEEAVYEFEKSAEIIIILAEYLVDNKKTTKTVKIILNDTQSMPHFEHNNLDA